MKIAIQGFGRIGRALARLIPQGSSLVSVNTRADINMCAHLLKYDSVHGPFSSIDIKEDKIEFKGQKVSFSSHKRIPEGFWSDQGVDILFECSGALKKKEDLLYHIEKGGAKKVLVSAPCEGAQKTVVYGVNHKGYDPSKDHVLSNASCTTNCVAPLLKVLQDAFGVEYGFMTTIHSYTNDQNILDNSHRKDKRRARAAALSMVPTSTGATKALGKILPQLEGKVEGVSIRVPTANVSLVDLVVKLEKKASLEDVNGSFLQASKKDLKGVLSFEKEPLVSSDFNGNLASAIVDLSLTQKSEKENVFKIFSWYDNEMGFSQRMWDLAHYISKKGI